MVKGAIIAGAAGAGAVPRAPPTAGDRFEASGPSERCAARGAAPSGRGVAVSAPP